MNAKSRTVLAVAHGVVLVCACVLLCLFTFFYAWTVRAAGTVFIVGLVLAAIFFASVAVMVTAQGIRLWQSGRAISSMTNRLFLLSALTVLVIALAFGWLVLNGRVAYFSGRVAYLTLDRRLRIEVNGVPVEGEILDNRTSAIVTIRDAGKKHSYQLYYEGDVDFTGDMGFVVDCHEWVAPHFPFLLQTRSYPPCTRLFAPGVPRWPLILRGHSMQFVTKDHATISVVMPD